MKKEPHQIKKMNSEFINNFKYPQRNIYNHPKVVKSTISGAVFVGILVALITWVLSAGVLGTKELEIITMNPVFSVFIGFITGSAIGGLIGNLSGIFMMLKERG